MPTTTAGPMEQESLRLDLLHRIARQVLQDLELEPMLQRVTDALRDDLGCDLVAVALVESDRFVCKAVSAAAPTDVRVGYSRELGSGVLGEVAATSRPVRIDDLSGQENFVQTTPGVRSELCVPIRHRDDTVALLNAESRQSGAFIGQEQFFATVADLMAAAIAKARDSELLSQHVLTMEVLSTVSKVALEETDLDALLQRTVDFLVAQFPVSVVSIILLDEAEEYFVDEASSGSLELQPPTEGPWPVSVGLAGRCVRDARPQLYVDGAEDPDYVPGNPAVRSEYVVPIRYQGHNVAVLNLESTEPDTFDEYLCWVFRSVADQIAGAINIVRINDQLEESQRLVEDQRQALVEANRRLREISHQDGLTGIANRRRFDSRLEVEWRRAQRDGTPLCLLLLDLDYFKPLNDTLGHQAGDECLRQVATELAETLRRAGDLVARYGGEEFAALLPGLSEKDGRALAETLRERVAGLGIANPGAESGEYLTISIGVGCMTPDDDHASSDLLQQADEALYRAKRAGRNRVA